jgi:ribosomal protein S14
MTIKWYDRDRQTKNQYLKFELEKLVFKSILQTNWLTLTQKLSAYEQFLSYKKTSSCSYYRRYSIINFNGRAVSSQFKLHRLVCKQWASYGNLIGLRKASF